MPSMTKLPEGTQALDLELLAWLEDRSVNFNRRVYAVVRLVPSGWVTTYGDVGTVMGSPRLARQVGWALNALMDGKDIDPVPWQRVINAKGMVSFRGDTLRGKEQIERLEAEGVHFNETGCCDLTDYRWPFKEMLV